ncbi:MAG TPA: TIGR01777 family oxidoreductase [Vicinamibacterales bacterium]|nr:TIGR01777 family oxidoreductase [Vicinamibacterales bacterium]
MRVVIAGGGGFLGGPLAWAWAEDGHDVRVLTRGLAPGQAQHESGTGRPGITRVGWEPDGSAGQLAREFDGAAAVVNLAGTSIAGGRWTPARKKAIHDSRIRATQSLAAAFGGVASPPGTFISASGVGYYGDRGSDVLTESAAPGSDFLANVCVAWEAEARRAERSGVRVVLLRTGMVLEKEGGALPRMMRPFRFFVGGPIAGGRQYVSWIHRHDWTEMVRWIVETPDVAGPLNVTAPHPVTNRDLARALGRALRRPALAPAPRVVLKLALGEMAEGLLFASQRAVPSRALAAGYHFRYPEIDIAFRGIFGD